MNAASLADRLIEARATGTVVDPPEDLDEASGFAVQDAIAARATAPFPAWKVGATAAGAAHKIGLSEPFIGPLDAASVTLCDGETSVSLCQAHTLQVEVEIAFRFAAPVPPDAPDGDILASVDAIAAAIEFPGQRWRTPLEPPGPGFVADHAGSAALVIGPFESDWRTHDLAEAEARLFIDGVPTGQNKGAHVMGSPINALVHFARRIGARGHEITPGLILTSGGIIGPLPVAQGATVTAEVDGLAPLVVKVTA